MRKINKIFKSLLFVGFILLMTNCAKDDIGQQNVVLSSTEVQKWFDIHKSEYGASVLTHIKNVRWNEAISNDGAVGEVTEVPFSLEDNLDATSKEANLYNDHHRLMFVKDDEKGFKLFYVQIFSEQAINKEINYYSVLDDFAGKVLVQELETNIGIKLEFSEGKKIDRSLTARYDEEVCVYYGYWYEDGHFEALYEVGCYGGTGSTPPNPGSGTPGPGYGNGGGGAAAPLTPQQEEMVVETTIEGAKIDPKVENNCFDKTKPATLTIYVQQPNENTNDKMGANGIGHAFIGIKQDGIERIMGFYPDTPATAVFGSQPSELHDNSNTLYQVSVSVGIDATQLTNVINYVNNYPKTYTLQAYNCTDFAIAVAGKGGLTLPKTKGNYISFLGAKFSARNPGDLGQDIRNMSTPAGAIKTTTKGNAPTKKGGC